jgi:hypothetical protein
MELKHLKTLHEIARGGLQLGLNQLNDEQLVLVAEALRALSADIADAEKPIANPEVSQ